MSSFFTDVVTAPDAPSMRLLRRCRAKVGAGDTRCVQTAVQTAAIQSPIDPKVPEGSGLYAFDELEVTHKRQALPDLSERIDDLTEPQAAPKLKLAELPNFCDPAEERTLRHARRILQDFPIPTLADLVAPTDVYKRVKAVRSFARPRPTRHELSSDDEDRTTLDLSSPFEHPFLSHARQRPKSNGKRTSGASPEQFICDGEGAAKRPPKENAILLTRRTNAWIDDLPEAARRVLRAAVQMRLASSPRLAGAVATRIERISSVPTSKYKAITAGPKPPELRLQTSACFDAQALAFSGAPVDAHSDAHTDSFFDAHTQSFADARTDAREEFPDTDTIPAVLHSA